MTQRSQIGLYKLKQAGEVFIGFDSVCKISICEQKLP